MAKSSYEVKQPNIFGRIGTGVGQGLAEQVPKEIERYRLSSGLKELGKQESNDPWDIFTGLISQPGVLQNPQLLQSAGNLLRQRGMLKGLQGDNNQQENKFSQVKPQENVDTTQEPRSITTTKGTEATRKPYIPMTTPQKQQLAKELNAQQPSIYPDYDTAYSAAEKIDQENQNINTAHQNQRLGEQNVQSTLLKELDDRANLLGAKLGTNIPGLVMATIQDRAIDEQRNGKLTEKELAAKYGKEIDKLIRQYQDIHSVGSGLGVISRSSKSTLSTLDNLSKKFRERGESRNFAQYLQSSANTSPMISYAIAEPIKNEPEISSYLKNIPKLKSIETLAETVVPKQIEQTQKIIPKLAELLKKNGNASPLSIAYELKKKNYDPSEWIKYLDDNQKKLNLRSEQEDQLSKTVGDLPTISDLWLKDFSGLGD